MNQIKILSLFIRVSILFQIGFICFLLLIIGSCKTKVDNNINKNDFINPPSTVKIHTWWHWVDGAISKEGITKDLESMHQQGISQATILNVGIFDGKDLGVPRVVFNTPQWYDMFKWALSEANRLGIKIGIHNCDGWSSSGGPWITPEMSMKQFVWTKTIVEGEKSLKVQLKRPMAKMNFYKDVAVVAYQTKATNNSFQIANPLVTINDSIDAGVLSDGNPVSGIEMKRGDFAKLLFKDDFAAKQILIHIRRPFMWRNMAIFNSQLALSTSNDGKNYKKVQDIEIIGLNKSVVIPVANLKSKFFKLQLIDYSTVDPQYGFSLSEVQLLGANDQITFTSTIPNLLEKTVSIKAVDKSVFDQAENSPIENLIQDENSVVDLSKNLSADGTLNWDAPEGNWCIIRFGYTTTGAMNAPATKEGMGLECDKMDTSSVGFHFRNYPQKLITKAGQFSGNTFKFILIDSWECNYQNWTTNFTSEFEKQQGYSIIKWIPVLCGETIGNSQLSEGFLYDFRKTIANLIENNYYKYFRDLCHKQNIEMHAEVIYGDANYPPIDVLKSNTYADLPMFEFWAGPPPAKNFPEPYVPQPRIKGILPVYAANCYQLPIIAAEAYTSWAHYSEYPFYLKPFGDRAFCSGINQLILHSYVHQPTDKTPGITLGIFGSHFNRLNPWWSMTSDWFTYQNRIQYILQKGEIVSDVLYFLGDQLPQFISNSAVDKLPYGYRANACNNDVLLNKVKVEDGKIVLSPNQIYSILVLPDNRALELSSLKRIAELVNDGAIVYGQKPINALSLKGRRDEVYAFRVLANKLWGAEDNIPVGKRNIGKGKITWGLPLEKVFQKLNVKPDLETDQSDSLNIQFIHKKIGDADFYFVANQQNIELKRDLIFRVSKKQPEIWNPENGSIQKISNYSNENNLVRIPVTFNPYESLVFVFCGIDTPHKLKDVKTNHSEEIIIDKFTGSIKFSPAYPSNISPIDITQLHSWTEFKDPSIKYFSGKAKYTIHFKMPDKIKLGIDTVLLSLGRIEVIGSVRLNSKWLGNIWIPDYKIDVTNILKTDNELQVEVANVYRNRIIGDLIENGKAQNVWTTSPIETYFDKDKSLKPSGLLGPITLIITNSKNSIGR